MVERVDVDGIDVCYDVEGSGDGLLLAHGMGIGREVWKDFVAQASMLFEVYAIDLPGFGCSDKPDVPYGIPYYAEFLPRLMGALKLKRAAIAGISLGGAAAALLAARHPEMVSRLVLVAPVGLTPLTGWPVKDATLMDAGFWLMARNKELFVRLMGDMFFDSGNVPAGLLDEMWARMKNPEYRRTLLRNSQSLFRVDPAFAASLAAIKAPTLIVWGADDLTVPASDAGRFAGQIPASEVRIVERCGHLVPLERKDAFASAVLSFLGEVDLYYASDGA